MIDTTKVVTVFNNNSVVFTGTRYMYIQFI